MQDSETADSTCKRWGCAIPLGTLHLCDTNVGSKHTSFTDLGILPLQHPEPIVLMIAYYCFKRLSYLCDYLSWSFDPTPR